MGMGITKQKYFSGTGPPRFTATAEIGSVLNVVRQPIGNTATGITDIGANNHRPMFSNLFEFWHRINATTKKKLAPIGMG